MSTDIRSLLHDLRAATCDFEVATILCEIAARIDRAGIPVLTRQLHRTGTVAEVLVEALACFGDDAVPALRRVAEHANDWDARRHALLVLARLGDVAAMRALARDYRRAGSGPLATARWLLACGRPGILVLADSPRDDLFEVQELARHRGQTEHLLLELVERRDAPLPLLALAALARMPSARAAPTFVRVLAHRSRGFRARKIALRGLELLGVRSAAPLMHRIACDDRERGTLRAACVDALRTLAAA